MDLTLILNVLAIPAAIGVGWFAITRIPADRITSYLESLGRKLDEAEERYAEAHAQAALAAHAEATRGVSILDNVFNGPRNMIEAGQPIPISLVTIPLSTHVVRADPVVRFSQHVNEDNIERVSVIGRGARGPYRVAGALDEVMPPMHVNCRSQANLTVGIPPITPEQAAELDRLIARHTDNAPTHPAPVLEPAMAEAPSRRRRRNIRGDSLPPYEPLPDDADTAALSERTRAAAQAIADAGLVQVPQGARLQHPVMLVAALDDTPPNNGQAGQMAYRPADEQWWVCTHNGINEQGGSAAMYAAWQPHTPTALDLEVLDETLENLGLDTVEDTPPEPDPAPTPARRGLVLPGFNVRTVSGDVALVTNASAIDMLATLNDEAATGIMRLVTLTVRNHMPEGERISWSISPSDTPDGPRLISVNYAFNGAPFTWHADDYTFLPFFLRAQEEWRNGPNASSLPSVAGNTQRRPARATPSDTSLDGHPQQTVAAALRRIVYRLTEYVCQDRIEAERDIAAQQYLVVYNRGRQQAVLHVPYDMWERMIPEILNEVRTQRPAFPPARIERALRSVRWNASDWDRLRAVVINLNGVVPNAMIAANYNEERDDYDIQYTVPGSTDTQHLYVHNNRMSRLWHNDVPAVPTEPQVLIVATLPSTGSEGQVIFNTRNNCLFRWTGSAWGRAHARPMHEQGVITTRQLVNGEVTAAQLQAATINVADLVGTEISLREMEQAMFLKRNVGDAERLVRGRYTQSVMFEMGKPGMPLAYCDDGKWRTLADMQAYYYDKAIRARRGKRRAIK